MASEILELRDQMVGLTAEAEAVIKTAKDDEKPLSDEQTAQINSLMTQKDEKREKDRKEKKEQTKQLYTKDQRE